MSRIESGTVKIEESPVHLPDLIEDIRSIIQASVSAKHQQLNVNTHIENEDIITDRLRLNQILLNILSNAVKFSDNGGRISFTVGEKPCTIKGYACLEFDIEDDGIGMSSEFIKNIFDPFTREHSSTVSGIQGTGLGMAITKNIVEIMNVTISVESAKGKGSKFTVILTLKNSDRVGTSDFRINVNDMRVLVVDDEEIAAEHARMVLDEAGIKADVCYSGHDALNMLKIQHTKLEPYNLVLLDWKMPDMDGLKSTEMIRKLDRPDAGIIPIIAMTANAFDEDVQLSLQVGMNAHLSKPVETERLYHTLEELIWEADRRMENISGK
ncbi:MAG: response regulator [Lachnospiraceae bacterium]|nr:response regulator [Lachnospiraceae bacterium]